MRAHQRPHRHRDRAIMRGKDILGLFNILIVIGILGGISYAALVLRPAEYDPDTLCLAGEVPPHVAW
jgi:hypothetical protein